MLKVAALANWGLGLEMVRTLHESTDTVLEFIVTRFDDDSTDPWLNRVRDFALEKDYEILHEKDVDFTKLRELLTTRKVDLMVCHAYMKLLPREVFEAPRLGSVNVHASLLPKYRGRSPHLELLASGDRESGLTCHFIDKGLDTGKIVYQEKFGVKENETIESLHEKQNRAVEPLIRKSLRRLADPGFKPVAQK